jgi:hypothetical protein
MVHPIPASHAKNRAHLSLRLLGWTVRNELSGVVQTGKEFAKIGIKDGRVEGVGQGVWRRERKRTQDIIRIMGLAANHRWSLGASFGINRMDR